MRALVVVAGVAVVAGVLYAMTMAQAGHVCEACVTFEGRTECRSVVAGSREEAGESAIANACAILTQGVTSSIRCTRTPPVSLQCRER